MARPEDVTGLHPGARVHPADLVHAVVRQTGVRAAQLSTVLAVAALAGAAHASEGGTTHYVPGALATLIDLPPTQPGFVVEGVYLRYAGDTSADLPIAGLATGRVNAESDAWLLGGFYTFEPTLLGAHYSAGLFLPFVSIEVSAEVETLLGSVRRQDQQEGLGDLTLLPAMLAWEYEYWQFNTVFSVYAPTGDYERGRLANAGLNYWTFDPTVGVSYNHDKLGFNAAVHTGFSFNTENDKTDYQSGTLFHLDSSVQQLLPVGPGFLGAGAEIFLLEQIEGDSGSGANLGDFEGRTWGVGPVLTYVLPWDGNNFVVEVRWLPEIDVEKRLEGDYIWVKAVLQF